MQGQKDKQIQKSITQDLKGQKWPTHDITLTLRSVYLPLPWQENMLKTFSQEKLLLATLVTFYRLIISEEVVQWQPWPHKVMTPSCHSSKSLDASF